VPEDEPQQSAIVLPDTTRQEAILDTVSSVTALVPVLGGPIANILSGLAGDRRFARTRDVLVDLANQVGDLSADQEEYVRSEDFEDLLIETMRRVAAERSEDKRRVYRQILTSAIQHSGEEGYDEQVRILRVMEELQPDHLVVLRAMMVEPETDSSVFMGSRSQTLSNRLPDMPEERVRDLADQLGELRLVNVGMLGGMVTGASAVDLRGVPTPLGERLVAFVLDADA
jgi:hypothetical protein